MQSTSDPGKTKKVFFDLGEQRHAPPPHATKLFGMLSSELTKAYEAPPADDELQIALDDRVVGFAPLLAAELNLLLIRSPDARVTRRVIGYHARAAEKVKATNRVVEMEEDTEFGSFLEALWSAEKVEPPEDLNEDGEKEHDVRVLVPGEADSEPLSFTGERAAELLQLIAPGSCGDALGRKQVAFFHYSDQSLRLTISLPTLGRTAAGGSILGKSPGEWEEAILSAEPGKINRLIAQRKFPDAFRNKRFWTGLFVFHAFAALLLRRYPEYSVVRRASRAVITSVLLTGRWENEISTFWKGAIESVMNTKDPTGTELRRQVSGSHELSCLYKLRKNFLKDETNVLTICNQAIDRFCSDPQPHDAIAEIGVRAFARQFDEFVSRQGPGTLQRWRDHSADHQGGAGVFTTRSAGGRASEMHLIVGLYRLSKGVSSSLRNVFPVPLRDLTGTLTQLSHFQEHSEEIFQACVWWIKATRTWPSLMYAIFPEREPKARTFLLFDYARQYIAHLFIRPLREFLAQDPDFESAFRGERKQAGESGGSAYDPFAKEMARLRVCVGAVDASTATDGHGFDTCVRLFELTVKKVIEPEVYELGLDAVRPRYIAATDSRPSLGFLDSLGDAEGLFRKGLLGGTRLVTHQLPPFKTHPGNFDATPHAVPDVRLRPHVGSILESLRASRVVVLKAETGSGKSVVCATMTDCIMQMPSVAAMLMFQESLRFFGRDSTVYYSLKKEEPRNGVPVLTTGAFVSLLAHRLPRRLVVIDEAEAKTEDTVLNIHHSRSWKNATVIMSATPDSLNLAFPHRRLNLSTPSPYEVTEETISVNQLKDKVRECLAFGRVLIVVHSEPAARLFAAKLSELGSLALTASVRAGDLVAVTERARVIISTHVVRSSVTLPGLYAAFDFQLKYQEVDFPAQGLKGLVKFRANADEIAQLRGRVGRTGPGRYVVVTHFYDWEPPSPLVTGRTPRIARLVAQGIPIDSFSQPLVYHSLVCENVTQQLVLERFGVELVGLAPLHVRAATKVIGDDSKRAMCILLLALEESGLLGKGPSLREGLLDEERMAYQSLSLLQKAPEDELPRRAQDFFRACQRVPAFTQQCAIIGRWMKPTGADTDDEEEAIRVLAGQLEEDWEPLDVGVRDFAATFLWRAVVQRVGDKWQGLFRDFESPVREGDTDEEFAVLYGTSVGDGAVQHACALALSPQTVEDLREDLANVELPLIPEVEPISPDGLPAPAGEVDDADDDAVYAQRQATFFGFRFRREVLQKKGKTKDRIRVALGQTAPTIHAPESLTRIMETLLRFITSCAKSEWRQTVKGMPMSLKTSFPTLNSMNKCSLLATLEILKSRISEFHVAKGFGDDGIIAGSRQFCELWFQIRERFGLKTNTRSTGIFDPADDDLPSLTVFCEAIYDCRTGERLDPPKPKALVALASALAPEHFITPRKNYYPDVRHIESKLRAVDGRLYGLLTQDEPALEIPVRSTRTRWYLRRALEAELEPGEPVVSRDCARELLAALEPFALVSVPSSQGAPERVEALETKFPAFVGIQAARRAAEFLRAQGGEFEPYGVRSIDALVAEALGVDREIVTTEELLAAGAPTQVVAARGVKLDELHTWE